MTNPDVKALVAKLRSPLPVCPFDRRSPDYWTTANDKPCRVCGGTEEVDKCRGADLRVMEEAAVALTRLADALSQPHSGCPEGWRVVPCEPTSEMHTALTELGRITVPDEHERDQWNWYAVRAYRTMLQAAPEPPISEGWRPIETAPKDGTEVLLRVKLRAGIPGKMLVGHHVPGGHSIEDHPAIQGGWYFWNGCMFDRAAEPTRWQPLPEPPTP